MPQSSDKNPKESMLSKIKNNKKLLYIIIALIIMIIAILAFVLITLSKSEPVQEIKQAPKKEVIKESTPDVIEPPKYEFKIDHINVTRLNKKLKILTKYELMGITEEEYLKRQELEAQRKAKEEAELKEKQRLEAEQKAKEEAQRLEEEKLAAEQKAKEEAALLEQQKSEAEQKAKEEAQPNSTTTQNGNTSNELSNNEQAGNKTPQNNDETVVQSTTGKDFVKFVQIATHKKIILKAYLSKIKAVDSRISACRNQKDFMEILIGPLNEGEDYQAIITKLGEKNIAEHSKFVEITEEEFNKRCIFN